VQGADVSGLLLRSQIVTGWPTLLPEAAGAQRKLPLLRSARLAPNVLLCLFDGPLESITFRNPPTLLHFEVKQGLQRSEGEYQLLKLDTAHESAELACSILATPH
jgi:hypothetical protein